MKSKSQFDFKKAKFFLLWFIDILGILRGRTIPSTQVKDALENGVGFDGSSIPGFVEIERSDLRMRPDESTFSLLPFYFYSQPTGRFFCDILTLMGKYLKNILAKSVKDMQKSLNTKL